MIKFTKEQRQLAREMAKKNLEALVVEGRLNGSNSELLRKIEGCLDILEDDDEEDEEEGQSG